MKRISVRSVAAVALVAAMGVSLPAVAYADSGSKTSTHHSSSTATSTWKAFHASWRAYVDGLKSIRFTYRAAVETARAAYIEARASATTPAEHQAALATFDNALAAALNARVAAITAAGAPPAPPAGYIGTAWVMGVQAANVAFRASVSVAQTTYAKALSSATTRLERRTARLTFEEALDSALVARSAALLALGAPPADPGHLA